MTEFLCVNCKERFESEDALNRHTTLEKIKDGQLISISESASILFADVPLIHPALDLNPDRYVILTVPFPGITTTTTAKGEGRNEASTILVCVTSDREYFHATQEQFLKRKLFAKPPQPVLEQRWSADSLKQFLFGEAPKVSPSDIFLQIRERFNSYMDFGDVEGASTFCSLYTLGTYFFFLFEYFPYLKAGGEKGSAKSKLGKLFQAMAFNANNSGDPSTASIYRFARETRGTMIIDEGEGLQFKDEQKQAYQAVLLNGWERTGSVLRIDTEGGNRPERIPTYCPKIICSIGGIIETLEDRAFELILVKTKNDEISNREVHQASKEWTPIRDGLYLCLMQYWREIQTLDQTIRNDLGLPGRLWNIAKPLLVMARFIDNYRIEGAATVEPEIVKFLRSQQKEKDLKAESSLTGSLIEALSLILKENARIGQEGADYSWRIPLSKVLDKVRELEGDVQNPVTGKYSISSKRLAALLRNLRLYKEPKRDNANGSYTFLVSVAQVHDVMESLSLTSTEDTERPEGSEQEKRPPISSEEHSDDGEGSTGGLILTSVNSGNSVTSVTAHSFSSNSISTNNQAISTESSADGVTTSSPEYINSPFYCCPCNTDYGSEVLFREHLQAHQNGFFAAEVSQ